jgi:hypothetical protein
LQRLSPHTYQSSLEKIAGIVRHHWKEIEKSETLVKGSQYVGESFQPFNKRMNGHRSDHTKKTLLPVSQHFVSPGHLLDDFGRSKIYIIAINNMKRMRKCNDDIYQLAKDQALVKKLKNKRFRPFCLYLPDVIFVTRGSKKNLSFLSLIFFPNCRKGV